jgi:CHAD domain-containing protein
MREREVKLDVRSKFRLPKLGRAVRRLRVVKTEVIDLRADYYDTRDLRLIRWGASLRYREPEGWTVKLPEGSGDAMLTRHEHTFPGEPGTPPHRARDLVIAFTRAVPLDVVARIATRRHRYELADRRGHHAAEVVDDHVTVLKRERVTKQWRELEVELAEDARRRDAKRLVRFLQKAGAGRARPVPKIAKAIGRRALAPPDVVVPRVRPRSRSSRVVRAAIASSVARLLAHDPLVRIGTDPEGVHQARVATRRLRSDLRTFDPLVDHEWASALRDELKWIGGALGAVRDADVLGDLLRAQARALPAEHAPDVEEILARLAAQRDTAREALLADMRSDRYVRLLNRLVEAARSPRLRRQRAHRRGAAALPGLVRTPWKRVRKAARHMDRKAADTELHQLRIKAKRARYATEAVAPVSGAHARRLASRLAALQDVLGEHQDLVVARGWLADVARDTDRPQLAFVAGELAGVMRARQDDLRRRWPEVWRTLDTKSLTDWL